MEPATKTHRSDDNPRRFAKLAKVSFRPREMLRIDTPRLSAGSSTTAFNRRDAVATPPAAFSFFPDIDPGGSKFMA